MEYIGETGRNCGDRYKEHLRAPSPIFNHSQASGHSIKLAKLSIVDRESQGITRTIKEAMYIGVNNPPLSRNFGRYQLPHKGWGVTGHASSPFTVILPHTPFSPHGPPPTKGAHNNFLGRYGPPRLLPLPTTILHFGASFMLPYFGAKLVSITFSLRPDETLLVFTS